MPSPLLKVCGLRDPDQAAAVAALGVDAVGVIAVPASPRHLEASLRPGLFARVEAERAGCLRVLVVADPDDADLPQLDPLRGGHQVVQLHGDESLARCRELRRRLPGAILWKALRLREPADLPQAQAYAAVVDALLLDAWVSDQLGGTGRRLPLEWLRQFRPPVPWWLAGGIRPEVVAEVLAAVQPDGLDASSGVENSPGVKNLARVEALLAAVRSCGAQPPRGAASDSLA